MAQHNEHDYSPRMYQNALHDQSQTTGSQGDDLEHPNEHHQNFDGEKDDGWAAVATGYRLEGQLKDQLDDLLRDLNQNEAPGASLGYRALAEEENLAAYPADQRRQAIEAIMDTLGANYERPSQDYQDLGSAVAHRLLSPIYDRAPAQGYVQEHMLADFRTAQVHADFSSVFIETPDKAEALADVINGAIDYVESQTHQDAVQDRTLLETKCAAWGGADSFLAGEHLNYNQARPWEATAEAVLAAFNEPRVRLDGDIRNYAGDELHINWNQAFTQEVGYRPESGTFKTPEQERAASLAAQVLNHSREEILFHWQRTEARAGNGEDSGDEERDRWASNQAAASPISTEQYQQAHQDVTGACRGMQALNYMAFTALRSGDPLMLDQTRHLAGETARAASDMLDAVGSRQAEAAGASDAAAAYIPLSEAPLDHVGQFHKAISDRRELVARAAYGYAHLKDNPAHELMAAYAAHQMAGDEVQKTAKRTADVAMEFNGHVAHHGLMSFYNQALHPWESALPGNLARALTAGEDDARLAWGPLAGAQQDLNHFVNTYGEDDLKEQDDRVRFNYLAMQDAVADNPEWARRAISEAAGRCDQANPGSDSLLVGHARQLLASAQEDHKHLTDTRGHGLTEQELGQARHQVVLDYTHALAMLELCGSATPEPG